VTRSPSPSVGPEPDTASRDAIARFVGPISAATLISRILGFVRDVIIAQLFGAALAADAFFVAFAIPSMFRRLLTEGALTSAFIPVYSNVRAREGEMEARLFAGAMTVSLAVFLAIFCLLGIYFARPIVAVLAPGFAGVSEKFEMTTRLTRIMFPFLFFIGLSAIAVGVLNSARRFFLPALAPAVQNIAMIAALTGSGWFVGLERAIFWLAWGVVIGGALQLLIQIPLMWKLGISPIPSWPWRAPSVGRCLSLMGPAAFGVAILQVNVLIDRWLASFLQEGSISYLYYANRLVLLPHGILSVAVAAAVFPLLADSEAEGRRSLDNGNGTRGMLAEAGKLTMFITLPATFGLMALARPIMEVLFEHGAFTAADSARSAATLRAYALGLVFFGFVRLMAAAYHARLDTKFPVRCANWSVLANMVVSVALMFPLDVVGLALATSLASALNAWLLFRGLNESDAWPGDELARAAKTLLPLSVAMGVGIFALNWIFWPVGAGIGLRAGVLGLEVIAGAGAYLFLSKMIIPETAALWGGAFGRKKV
jgi:putative peptidoglycan lipid II flippase